MRSWLRTGRLFLGLGWETGPATFLGFVAFGAAMSVAELVFALGLRPLINGVYAGDGGEATIGVVVCGVSLVVVVVTPACTNWLTTRMRERSIMVLQRRLLRMSTDAPGVEHFERPEYWDRLQLLKRNFGTLLTGMANALIAPMVIGQMVVITVVLGRLNPWLALIPLVSLPTAWLTRRAEALRRQGDQQAADRRRLLEQLFDIGSSPTAGKEVRTYGLAGELVQRHRQQSDEVNDIVERTEIKALLLNAARWVLFAGVYTGTTVIIISAAAHGRVSAGSVALTLSMTVAVVAVAGQLTFIVGLLAQANAVADHYDWLADQLTDRSAGPAAAADAGRAAPGFQLRDVSFRYPGSDRPVLTGIDLDLRPGTVVAVVGENGAGKTTLVKLLSRMYAPSAGRILLDGRDISSWDLEDYRQGITAGFQDFVNFELVARKAVGVGDLPRIGDEAEVSRCLSEANADFVEGLDHGLDTQLGNAWTGGTDLSGGQWQKIALARTLMRRRPVLSIYDEPTASLDPQSEHQLFERIAANHRDGSITLLISHRFSTVRMADLIVVLDHGRIIEQGTHAELLANGGLYAELYLMQAKAYA
ncbi:MAG TPA: ABC transporter ATP-binding protein [Jatrophihabitans sp.]|nr:ABC transporter ATP-binding protein [Jatrophihabitans sp.]